MFKFNAGLIFILVNTETDMMRFYHASYNNADIFERPVLIRNQLDWERALDIIYGSDLLEQATKTKNKKRPGILYNIFTLCFIFDFLIKISSCFLLLGDGLKKIIFCLCFDCCVFQFLEAGSSYRHNFLCL